MSPIRTTPIIESVTVVAALDDGSTQTWVASGPKGDWGISVDVRRDYPPSFSRGSFAAEVSITNAQTVEGPFAPSLRPPVTLENVQLTACDPVQDDDGRLVYVTTLHGFLPDGQLVEAAFRTDSLVYPGEGRERR